MVISKEPNLRTVVKDIVLPSSFIVTLVLKVILLLLPGPPLLEPDLPPLYVEPPPRPLNEDDESEVPNTDAGRPKFDEADADLLIADSDDRSREPCLRKAAAAAAELIVAESMDDVLPPETALAAAIADGSAARRLGGTSPTPVYAVNE